MAALFTRLAAAALLTFAAITPAVAQTARAQPASATATATWAPEARAFVSDLIADIGAAGGRAGMSQPDRNGLVAEILAEELAIERISSFILGGSAKAASPQQLAEYQRLVPAYIASDFAERTDGLAKQTFTFTGVTPRGADEVIVQSSFKRRRDNSNVAVNWRLIRQPNGDIKLLDVYLNGVSPWVLKRQEFSALVKKEGFDGLLAWLRTQTPARG